MHPEKGMTGYHDGAEDYVLSVLKKVTGLSAGSPDLSGYIRDWPSRYHFSIKRINLMASVKELLDKDSKVLEIGCGTGPITRWLGENFAGVDAIEGEQIRALATRRRTRDLQNVRVFCGDVSKTTFEAGKYGLATIIGVLEYIPFYDTSGDTPASSCLEFLKKIFSALQDNGVLALAIENKLGAKYFSGCREDHTNRHFDGLIDYPDRSPVTFSRNELKELLSASGFNNIQFYHLFPDYKLPETIIKEDDEVLSLYPYNWIKTPFEDYSGRRLHLFPELLFLKSITKAKLLWDFSNSFLVLAAKSGNVNLKTDWLIKKFYNQETHKPVFHHTAALLKDPEKGYIVERKPVFPGENEYSQENLVYSLEGESNFVHGDSLKVDVNRAIVLDAYRENLLNIMRNINAVMIKEFGGGETDTEGYPLVSGEAADYTFFNIIKSEDGKYNFIDRKWRFKDSIPADFVLYRNLCHVEFLFGPFIPREDPLDLIEFMKEIYPSYNGERMQQNERLEELFQAEINKG